MSSFTGPWGEAACEYCGTLQDLDPHGLFDTHNARGPAECPGSRRAPKETPKELQALAFSSEPITEICPACETAVPVDTVERSRDKWRFGWHRPPQLKGGFCRLSGLLVGTAA